MVLRNHSRHRLCWQVKLSVAGRFNAITQIRLGGSECCERNDTQVDPEILVGCIFHSHRRDSACPHTIVFRNHNQT
ncbi:hypothetical protein T4B_6835 [Trichinella pseudospiralis]|uniref:Uncharacterized protein n=2 Tax=Trichinella pseudospiralis TaxID=6337 RepID=A0A0V1FFL0_TRIPS|nr:hypothetical protein T4A_1297 [Trichinella pseudospiralis]KRY84543.1 hypothetical protein T4D_16132 [Trichinella pseudospiralis]KRZ25197.1 hypothetical protein T4B_6835 [Trichinella pseudospiralis]KRZ40196.1 hypothetical protein T4C_12265 [Trichinella pseudospiralis]